MGSIASMIQLATLWTNDGFYFAVHYYDRDGRTLFERKWIKACSKLFNLYVSKSRAGAHKRAGLPVGKRDLKKVETKDKPMIKYLIFAALIVCAVAIGAVVFKFANGSIFGGTSAPQAALPLEKVPTSPALPSARGSAYTAANPPAAYRITEEPFRLLYSDKGVAVMRTGAGEYRIGTMSRHGFVTGVDTHGRVAKCKAPDGKDVYVVGVSEPRQRIDQPAESPSLVSAPELPSRSEERDGPAYLDQGQKITLGYGSPANLDFMQARVTDGKVKTEPSAHVVERKRR